VGSVEFQLPRSADAGDRGGNGGGIDAGRLVTGQSEKHSAVCGVADSG
jgi:hypothetical protein